MASLETVYQFLVIDNFDWITAQLDITPLLPSGGTEHSNFMSSLVFGDVQPSSSCVQARFNPLTEFNTIGRAKFDHVSTLVRTS
jgi:hypothetical protein